ncbi:hypothetical protein COL20_14360 [Bacillus sp. AFS075034]|nr:hypothetical protein CN525_09040 [Bacillus sp. AFS014408]PFW62128.1 hypothetical protein COL20_14360 [Bacillus sp. AFS075034]
MLNPPISSKYTIKVYIQNTINKESKNSMNKNKHLIDIQMIRSNSLQLTLIGITWVISIIFLLKGILEFIKQMVRNKNST